MAYGFDTPSTFGRFWPDFEFPDHDAAVAALFERLKTRNEMEHKFLQDFGQSISYEFHYGSKSILEELQPRVLQLEKSYKALGDIFNIGYGLAISSEVRALVEELEPGRHQTWPLEVLQPSGEPYSKDYHFLRIRSRLDAWNKEKSDPACYKKTGHLYKIKGLPERSAGGIALSQDVISNHHIWRHDVSSRAGALSAFDYYVSDELKAALTKAKLKTPKLMKMMEV